MSKLADIEDIVRNQPMASRLRARLFLDLLEALGWEVDGVTTVEDAEVHLSLSGPATPPGTRYPMWMSAIDNPPKVGRYMVRKFLPETGTWFEGFGYYFGGQDMRWRRVVPDTAQTDRWTNAGPLDIAGLQYLGEITT